jgi:hypothetical protein
MLHVPVFGAQLLSVEGNKAGSGDLAHRAAWLPAA